ncbi:MAG: Asp-tRNA(Asn)/Glu-tRNA(Gln) amidotransferase subunit GatB [Chloroflexi bacterium]|nr:Asp-tRNA(Asn)/Glu-tRNA(Gln) amidotransferase subunit GatB [Chloroflexota bacterium]
MTAQQSTEYEIVIGLEVHSQLLTESKMFCACSAAYQDAPPNTTVCAVCLGMPGAMPVMNQKAVDFVIRTGLALGCEISAITKFDRKNYPYPDLMKGYQISQYDQPVAHGGCLNIETDDGEKPIGVTRVHLEEDVAKLFHRADDFGESYSLLDINRAGVPLMEIVSEPDMRSPDEARSYLTQLQSILRYIGVSSANMEEGNFRCDANISVRPLGSAEFGAKVEIKNMNSFRAVHRALSYEAERQVLAVKEGELIVQETRGWDDATATTFTQRTKEYAHDYRYFPEPDLPPLAIEDGWVQAVRDVLPELPAARRQRLMTQYGLSEYDANLLTINKATADYYESVVSAKGESGKSGDATEQFAKQVSNWTLTELGRLLNETNGDIEGIRITPQHFADLLYMVEGGALSSSMAKTVFEQMYNTGEAPESIAEEQGLVQISDTDALGDAVDEAIGSNPKPVAEYLEGKDQAIRFLVGQVMKITRGKANPQLVMQLLQERLDAIRQSA